jgi:3-hydroxyacyl-[acyl-carrier-protein] dehydratase
MKKYAVYILLCADNSYYTGITNDVFLREEQHNQGLDNKAYTYDKRPVKLVWYQEFTNPDEAISREKQLKGWNRQKKEALIANDLDKLPGLSMNSHRQAQTYKGKEETNSSLRQAQTDKGEEEGMDSGLRRAQTDVEKKGGTNSSLRQAQTDIKKKGGTNSSLRQAQTDKGKDGTDSSLGQQFDKLNLTNKTDRFKDIISKLPYTKPFLFVDEINEINDNGVVGNFTFKADSDFYKGHFKNFPVTPGVILTECCAQIGLVCLGIHLLADKIANETKIGLSSSEMEFLAPVFPNETVTVSSELVYFRFHKLKCKVKMLNANGDMVCKGVIAGMFKVTDGTE